MTTHEGGTVIDGESYRDRLARFAEEDRAALAGRLDVQVVTAITAALVAIEGASVERRTWGFRVTRGDECMDVEL